MENKKKRREKSLPCGLSGCGSVRTELRQPRLITSCRRRAPGSRLNLHKSSRGGCLVGDAVPFELRTTLGLQNCRRQRGARLPTAGSTSTWHTNHSFLGFGMVRRRGAYLCIPQLHQDPCRTLQMSTPDKNETRRCGEKLLVVVGATEQRVHRQNKQFFFLFSLVLFFFRKREPSSLPRRHHAAQNNWTLPDGAFRFGFMEERARTLTCTSPPPPLLKSRFKIMLRGIKQAAHSLNLDPYFILSAQPSQFRSDFNRPLCLEQ